MNMARTRMALTISVVLYAMDSLNLKVAQTHTTQETNIVTAITAVQEWMVRVMSDYIKREDAKKWLTNLREDCGRYQDLWPYAEALDQIIELLSVDVAPVRHGMWVDVDRMQMHDLHGVLTWGNSFMCTECNFKTFAVEGHMSQYNYCPNCGARMDGESNE